MAQPAATLSNEGYRFLDVRPVAGSLGAEVTGVDLGHLTDEIFDEIYRVFLDYQAVIFRDQELDNDSYLAFARRWGKIALYPYMKGLESHPEILEIVKTETDTYAFGNVWHSDGSFSAIPPKATMLYAMELPPAGGDTAFANMYQAYETLSDGMKQLLSTLKVYNVGDKPLDKFSGVSQMSRQDPGDTQVRSVHPAVRTHPDTGRKGLFVGGHTINFDGMTREESEPLITYLRNHAVRPEFTCRLRWEIGSLTIWDNRCTQHYAIDDYAGYRRRMRRITIQGEEAPF